MLVHGAFKGMGRPNWSKTLGSALEVGAVLLIIAFIVFFSRKEMTPWAMPIFAATIYIFAAERGALSDLLKTGVFQRLGQLSYSVYLTHAVVIASLLAASRLIGEVLDFDVTSPSTSLFPSTLDRGVNWILIDFGNLWLNDLLVFVILAAVLGTSALTWRFIELPGQRLFAALAARSLPRHPRGGMQSLSQLPFPTRYGPASFERPRRLRRAAAS